MGACWFIKSVVKTRCLSLDSISTVTDLEGTTSVSLSVVTNSH